MDIPFSTIEEEVTRAINENMEMLGGEEAFDEQMEREGFTVEELKKLYRQQIRNRKLVEEVLRIEMTQRPPDISDATLREFYEKTQSGHGAAPGCGTLANDLRGIRHRHVGERYGAGEDPRASAADPLRRQLRGDRARTLRRSKCIAGRVAGVSSTGGFARAGIPRGGREARSWRSE